MRNLYTKYTKVGCFLFGLFSAVCHSQILEPSIEIGLYQTNKNTKFIKDTEMLSPKSADFLGDRLIINALEKGKTLIYSTQSWDKTDSISHQFDKPVFENIKNFPYTLSTASFMGKPVEMTHSSFNKEAKIWIPYYRLSWDTYSRHHSAIAQINANTMKIEKLLPSGSIPKMVAYQDGILVSTHWGDNTVGIYSMDKDYNITSYDYIVIDKKLDISKISGDRDSNCGWCLRGTVFTPDSRYILISRMGGGGIAIIDTKDKKYIGTIRQVPLTPRHLVIRDNMLYLSTVFSGEVASIELDKIYEEIEALKNQKHVLKISDFKTLKLGSGIRTIAVDKHYIYAALNSSSELAIIDRKTMKLQEKYKVASYPVGLSVNDKYVAVTSQGKAGLGGGNHIDIFIKK